MVQKINDWINNLPLCQNECVCARCHAGRIPTSHAAYLGWTQYKALPEDEWMNKAYNELLTVYFLTQTCIGLSNMLSVTASACTKYSCFCPYSEKDYIPNKLFGCLNLQEVVCRKLPLKPKWGVYSLYSVIMHWIFVQKMLNHIKISHVRKC